MDRNRIRFQQELAEAWDDVNQRTNRLAQRGREVECLVGIDLSSQMRTLHARHDVLHDALDALWADDDAAFPEHAAHVAKALDAFEAAYATAYQRTDALYEDAIHAAIRRRMTA